MGMILGVVVFISYFIALYGAAGYTLSKLWNDFIPQIFTSLPHLNFYQALAVSLVVGLFSGGSSKIYDSDDELPGWKQAANMFGPFLKYGMALLIGAWLKSQMGAG